MLHDLIIFPIVSPFVNLLLLKILFFCQFLIDFTHFISVIKHHFLDPSIIRLAFIIFSSSLRLFLLGAQQKMSIQPLDRKNHYRLHSLLLIRKDYSVNQREFQRAYCFFIAHQQVLSSHFDPLLTSLLFF